MNASPAWLTVRRRGTVALLVYALLCPVAMAVWTVASYTLSSDSVRYWVGSETSSPSPRLRRVKKTTISLLEYAYHTVGAEYAATRYWTAFTAMLGGAMFLLAAMIPRPRSEGFLMWSAWLVAGLGLVALGIDERFQIHEWFSRLVTRPSNVVDDVGWLSSDVALLVYPVAGIALWWVLRPLLRSDPVAGFCLVGGLATGVFAVLLDVVLVDSLREFPARIYVDFAEELAEFETVALLSVLGWRRLAVQWHTLETGDADGQRPAGGSSE